jgi:formate C-acetyltransferase
MDKLPDRIIRLRDELFNTEGGDCFERAKLITASYKGSEGEPNVIRRARAFRDILRDTPIYIRDGELLVGARSARLGRRTTYPEYSVGRDAEWPPGIREYWAGNTIGDLSRRLHPDYVKMADSELAACYVTGTDTGFGHMIVDYDKAISKGLRFVIEEALRESEKAAVENDAEGRNFCDAVICSCEGVIAWANRYASLAARMAAGTEDAGRRSELTEIAEVCMRVPEFPARNFREALQAFWFIHLALHIEQKGWSISAGRFDQYMYPYYEKDISSGVTEEVLFELILSLWIKFMENVDSNVKMTAFQNLTLGGCDASGRDQSNALSKQCLDATLATGFNQPALSVRWHKGISEDFKDRIMRVIGAGLGMPALFNDDIIIKALIRNGVTRRDALDFGIVGCVEAAVSGKMQGLTAGGHVNIAKALEFALFDGRSLTSGRQIGLHTGDASEFNTFEELFAAYTRQSRWLSGINIASAQIAGDAQKILGHCPFCSSLLDDCLAKRRDMVDGGTRYSLSGVAVLGATNAADGLLALKKLVFEDRLYTMNEVLDALRSNYAGFENMRQTFLNHGCRFGNDIPEADETANRVYAVHAEFLSSHPDARGGHYTCGIWPVNGHVHSGYQTGASADGRFSGAPLVDGIGACQGADRSGPTALLKSVARLNNIEHWAAGNTCNIKFTKMSAGNRSGFAKIIILIDTFMRLGGQELQINVVDGATLRAAQQNPGDYADLVVRVAGYSAYFTTLGRDVQNEIISRMEQVI